MSFGKDLSEEFQKLTCGAIFDEVALFTKLQDAFINLKSVSKYEYAVEVIHGRTSLVDFQFNSSWTSKIPYGNTVRRELSDMLFVLYSLKNNTIRISYMQNKKGDSSDKFKADLCQLHLLSQRECIISKPIPECLFGDPNILSHAILPSIGSYGVFYQLGDRTEMAYYPAELLHPKQATGSSVVRIIKYDHRRFDRVLINKGFEENQGTRCLMDFGNALTKMQIGTPINREMPTYEKLGRFLLAHVTDIKESDLFPQSLNTYQDKAIISIPITVAINVDRV